MNITREDWQAEADAARARLQAVYERELAAVVAARELAKLHERFTKDSQFGLASV